DSGMWGLVTGGDAPIANVPAPSRPPAATEPSADPTTAGASNLVATPPDPDSTQPGTAEIPPADSADASQQQPPSPALELQPSSEVARYQEEQSGLPPAYSHGVHDALTGVAVAGAMVLSMVPGGQFAILLIPVLDDMQVGKSYDMIIGVDGSRVTNFLDFQDQMRDLQPGEVIYLSV